MGKRSDFERIPRDFYPTPAEAVRPLLDELVLPLRFIEPCAGDGALIQHLSNHECVGAFDIEPQAEGIDKADATSFKVFKRAECFITNPPWDRKTLHPIILNLSRQLPTWLLFDADWMHTKQSAPFMPYLRKIVSVGRVKWIADSPHTGKDNCCWYLFDQNDEGPTEFIGRKKSES